MGLVSFAAMAQLAPALFGAVLWRGGHAHGALAGVTVGITVWIAMLALPQLAPAAPWHLHVMLGVKDPLALGVFVSLGFAVSGWAKNEEVAAPIANIIALPMMFLSGVFFPRDAMPEPLRAVADFLPLSYLADALRNVAVDGASLWSQWENVLGLTVWLVVTFFIAVRLFRWE